MSYTLSPGDSDSIRNVSMPSNNRAGRRHRHDAIAPSSKSRGIIRFLAALLPSWIFTKRDCNSNQSEPENSRTDYLNGMRGAAAFVVVLTHIVGATHPNLYFGYGQGIGHGKLILQLPVVRLLYGGSAMVAIFFVISGYVLSVKPGLRARDQQWTRLHSELGSSVLRRGLRLFIPSIASSFLVMLAAQMGVFKYGDGTRSLAIFAITARRRPSIFNQMSRWIIETWRLFQPWEWTSDVPDLEYGVQLWTIPIELRSSMVLYLFIIALSRLKYRVRLVLLFTSQCYCLAWGRWDVFLFLQGMILADADLEVSEESQCQYRILEPKNTAPGATLCWKTGYRTTLLFAGLYLASEPEINSLQAPGYVFLNSLVSKTYGEEAYRFWIAIGASMIVSSIAGLECLKWPFRTSIAQYLGKISFSLYLVHNAVIASLGAWLIDFVGKHTGEEMLLAYGFGILVSMCFVIFASVWLAEVFWRAVDRPVFALTEWVESFCVDVSI
jgi:peptidoglycan/LPS O-acetylase OafA/YrhL